MALYKGYSSYEYQRRRTAKLTDVDLVKLDLLNHIFTLRGDRIMMSSFGTRIPALVFEPLDQITIDVLEEDLRQVFNFDPRVILLDLVIQPSYDTNTVIASALLRYVELDLTDNLDIHLTFGSGQ